MVGIWFRNSKLADSAILGRYGTNIRRADYLKVIVKQGSLQTWRPVKLVQILYLHLDALLVVVKDQALLSFSLAYHLVLYFSFFVSFHLDYFLVGRDAGVEAEIGELGVRGHH